MVAGEHQHLIGEVVDQRQRLTSLVAHQADGTVVDDIAQQQQILILERLLFRPDEVVPQIVLQLALLLADVREVDEESRAHVSLQHLDLLGKGRPVAAHQQVAVLEQATSADLFRVAGCDQLLLQVVQRFLEVAVYGLADHRRVEVLTHG